MSVNVRERRTQSTVWYLSLPLWEKYKTKLPKRKSFTTKIKEICEKRGRTRESYGIYAKARATMYFNGEQNAVTYDAIEELARNGTDIIFIEKEAIVEVLCDYSDGYGIALVDTEGFLTDYGKKLISVAEESGANLAVVSDYDASGIKLAHDAGDIPRLGVDQEMLDYFGLNRDDKNLSVSARAKIDVMSRIKGLVSDDVYNFLKHRKVEIDAVLAQVGSKRFWDYLITKLQEYYPTRDYTRVVDPEPDTRDYLPDIVYSLNRFHGNYVDLILEDEKQKVTEELEEFEGFIDDIRLREHEIRERYWDIVGKDSVLKELNEKLTTEIKPLLAKLEESIKKLADERKEKKRKEQHHD